MQDIDVDADGDPSDGDGKEFVSPLMTAADVAAPGVSADTLLAITRNGISEAVQFVKLQRLANPLVDYDDETNPYITVDVAPVDLTSFNGLNADDQITTVGAHGVDNFSTCERGHAGVGQRLLWPQADRRTAVVNAVVADLHHFDTPFVETFGEMNDVDKGTAGNVATTEQTPFAWLAWNNRPYVSQYEIINVPRGSSEEVLDDFDTSTRAHLLNFTGTNLKRVFGFLAANSLFVNLDLNFDGADFQGERRVVNTTAPFIDNGSVFNAPYNFVSRYRIPGKININAFTDAQDGPIWDQALFYNWGVASGALNSVLDVDEKTNGSSDSTEYAPGPVSSDLMMTYVVNDPIRPDGVADFEPPKNIADTSMVGTAGDGSILRATAHDDFFRSSSAPHDNTSRNYWFANLPVSKLANATTNRSSVFAIWVTVGYFEVDEDGRLGAEIGADSGEIVRNRAFYIFDRSIPVAYEPGKNHNVDKGILLKSIVE